jgi:hypothetical protein
VCCFAANCKEHKRFAKSAKAAEISLKHARYQLDVDVPFLERMAQLQACVGKGAVDRSSANVFSGKRRRGASSSSSGEAGDHFDSELLAKQIVREMANAQARGC